MVFNSGVLFEGLRWHKPGKGTAGHNTLERFQIYMMTQPKWSETTDFPIARKDCRPGKYSCLCVSSKQFGPSSLQFYCLHPCGAQSQALKTVEFPIDWGILAFVFAFHFSSLFTSKRHSIIPLKGSAQFGVVLGAVPIQAWLLTFDPIYRHLWFHQERPLHWEEAAGAERTEKILRLKSITPN